MSIADVLAVLYGKVMKIDPANPSWEDRDFFILSKGHGGPALYAALHLSGYFEEDVLYTLNQNGTALPSHPDRNLTPGVDMTTGSLGQGISVSKEESRCRTSFQDALTAPLSLSATGS
nr:hypothetical protein [Bacillus licheniformis]